MPLKLATFIILLTMIVIFMGFNTQNVSDINLGFYQFKAVPIFMSLFVTYVLGIFTMIPFYLFKGSKRRIKEKKAVKASVQEVKEKKINTPTQLPETSSKDNGKKTKK